MPSEGLNIASHYQQRWHLLMIDLLLNEILNNIQSIYHCIYEIKSFYISNLLEFIHNVKYLSSIILTLFILHTDYIRYWLGSIHTYSSRQAPVILVFSHAEDNGANKKKVRIREVISLHNDCKKIILAKLYFRN